MRAILLILLCEPSWKDTISVDSLNKSITHRSTLVGQELLLLLSFLKYEIAILIQHTSGDRKT